MPLLSERAGLMSSMAERIVKIDSKDELEKFFRQSNVLLHLYEIGDLDDFFWPHTEWYAIKDEEFETKFVALIYKGAEPPVIIALGNETAPGRELLQGMCTKKLLQDRFYSHLSLGLPAELSPIYDVECRGLYRKMGLTNPAAALAVDTTGVVRLLTKNLQQIESFYRVHYPGNWFDQRMLETTQTFGVWSRAEDDANSQELIAIAGVHVFSTTYRVAALGNIAVHKDHRGRGLAGRVTAALVQSLLAEGIEHIGLNVSASNAAAVACYTKLGFEPLADFEEIMWTLK